MTLTRGRRGGRQAALATLATSVMWASGAYAAGGKTPLLNQFWADELEYRFNGSSNPITWDAGAWVGDDWQRLRLDSNGERRTDARGMDAEAQLSYSYLVSAFWELRGGVRGDLTMEGDEHHEQVLVAMGVEGVAPYWIGVEPTVYVSHRGRFSGRLELRTDIFVTQRLVVEPSLEANAATQSAPEFGVGAGLCDVELALRLRYEFFRELAPYVGLSWTRRFGDTARLYRGEARGKAELEWLGGVRFWY